MIVRSSDRASRRGGQPQGWRAVTRDESGAILILLAVSLVMMMASAGLAIDLGRGYVEHTRISRAVDAGALAGARTLRLGQVTARAQAEAVARANGVDIGPGGTQVLVTFGVNARGENTVMMTASRPLPTTFMRILGQRSLDIGSGATAAVPPVDLTLVLDQSGSLEREGAWGDLQTAASDFVTHFDDGIDQVGLVSFQVRAVDRFLLGHDFTVPIQQRIAAMRSAGDTNTGEGLRLAGLQMQGPAVRPSSVKAVVFFTDGRPTALRTFLGSGGEPPDFDDGVRASLADLDDDGDLSSLADLDDADDDDQGGGGEDRVIAVTTTIRGTVRGYFDNPDNLPTDETATPDGCAGVPDCFGWDEDDVRNGARFDGLIEADAIRRAGITIYTIGLGNPNNPNPILQPDLDYLRAIANEKGVSNPDQPHGKMYFAPTPKDLEAVFQQVAQDLLVRLAR